MDYTRTSLADVRAGLHGLAQDVGQTFGGLDERQLNWRPDDSKWSAAQCLQHLIVANDLMMQAAERAFDGSSPRTIWQRIPVMPYVLGPMIVRSQAPTTTRRFVAPSQARPSISDIPRGIVDRFVTQHRAAVNRLETLDEQQAARTVMVSPFVRFITYSVLDGWRLMFAHDLRHVQQARRVLEQQLQQPSRGDRIPSIR